MECHHELFGFPDPKLQDRFKNDLDKLSIKYRISDVQGGIIINPEDEEAADEIIYNMLTEFFPEWCIVGFHNEWYNSYKKYVTENQIPYIEEFFDTTTICFIVEAKHNSHDWILEPPT